MHKYKNPHILQDKRSLIRKVLWLLGGYKDAEPLAEPPADFSLPTPQVVKDDSSPQILWVGHSTFILKAFGYTFLTDPVWSKRVPRRVGLKRKIAPGIALEEVPPVDFVLISHNHYDHLDLKTVRYLYRTFPECIFIVPLGLKRWLSRRGIKRVYEYDWWQEKLFSEDIRIMSVPAQHFSGRGLFDRNKTLWCGWLVTIQNCFTFYFAGDTGYNEVDFKAIGETRPIDFALIPIGAYSPRAFMSPVHLSPFDAVRVHKDLKAKKSMACHFATFGLSDEPMSRPPYDLFLALQQEGVDLNAFSVPKPGVWFSCVE